VIKRRIRAKYLFALALMLIAFGAMGALMGPGREPDRKIGARVGDVVWNHEQHARMEDIPNCQVCHHTERAGTTRPRPCSDCHRVEDEHDLLIQADLFMDLVPRKYEGEDGPPPMVAFHAKCIGCHQALEKGPLLCRDCHTPGSSGTHGRVDWNHYVHSRKLGIDAVEGAAHSDCTSCHHHDEEARTDGDYRPCSACHQPAKVLGQTMATGLKGIDGVSDIPRHESARHGECASCHVERNPENDDLSCQDCHEPWTYEVRQREMPNLEEAVHQRCRDCHRPGYSELTKRMPLTCNECHARDPSWLSYPEVGNVLWSHKRHGQYRDMDCTRCHHQDLVDEPHMACSSCHGKDLYENPPLAEALQRVCTECHTERDAGFQTWDKLVTEEPTVEHFAIEAEEGTLWWNHHAHALGDSFSCQECHHNILRRDGEYVTAQRIGRPWPAEAARVQACDGCHGETGPVAGSVAEGSEAPRMLEAYRKVCVECHQRLGGGPQSWEALFATPEIDWERILADPPVPQQEAPR